LKKNDNHYDEGLLKRLSGPFSALLLVNFTGAIGFSIVIPFLVFLVHQWGGNALIFGLASATYSIFQLFGSTFLGRWSDRFGRRRMLAMSQMGSVLAWLIVLAAFYLPVNTILSVDSSLLGKFSLTLPLILLFISRALDGLTGGNASVANAYVADITAEDQRDARFGKMGVASNLGAMIGPVLVGILSGTLLGYELPVLATMGISLLSLILTIVILPESKPSAPGLNPLASNCLNVMGKEHRACLRPEAAIEMSNADLVRLPGIAVFMLTYFLVMLAFNFFYVAFPLHAATEMQWTVKHIGAFFSVMSIFMVAVQGVVLPRLSRTWSDKRLVCVGAFVLGWGFITLASASDWMTFLGAVLIAVGNGLMWPPVVALLSKAAGKHQGAVQGLTGSVSAAAAIIGLLLAGILYSDLTYWLFILSATLIFAVIILSFCFPSETPPGSVSNSRTLK
jgi:DHA1 family tetracycline resistance protein-like MFS transporter